MKFKLAVMLVILISIKASSQVVDVDPFTGKAITTIPLWNLKSGSLSFPITLVNASNGIRADEYGGSAGIGWSISTESVVERELRGLPDEYNKVTNGITRQGWLINNTASTIGGFVPVADDNLLEITDEQADFNFLNSLGGFSGSVMKDTEPDIYTVSVPGLAAKFTFNNAGQIVFLSKQDYKVTYALGEDGAISNFTITNENGVTYRFGQPYRMAIRSSTSSEANIRHFKYKYFLYKDGVSFNYRWQILSIESTNGDKIVFEYMATPAALPLSDGTFMKRRWPSESETIYASIYNQPSGSTNNVGQYSISKTYQNNLQIKAVIGKSERIETTYGTIVVPAGEYVTVNQPILGSLDVYGLPQPSNPANPGGLIKSFKLAFESIEDTDTEYDRYLLLRSVTEVSGSLAKRPYVFDYYHVNFDNKTLSLDRFGRVFKDEFGYLDTNSSDDPLYKICVYPDLAGANKFRNKPVTGYSGVHHETPGQFSENPDFKPLQAMSLRQVVLPEGGTNRIFYEANIYRDNLAQTDYYGGGLRVKRVEFHDGVDRAKDIITNYSYENDDGSSSGVMLYRPLRAFTLNAQIDLQTGTTAYYHELLGQGLSAEEIIKRTTVISNGDGLNVDAAPESWIGYKKVTISRTGAGKTVYEYDIGAPFGILSEDDWTATRSRVARSIPPNSLSIVAHDPGPITGYYVYPFAPNPNADYKRGLLKRLSAYDNANILVRQTEYDYVFLSSPTKVYAIRLDQWKAAITRTFVHTGSGNTVTLMSDAPMFIYSRYEINTGVRSRIQKITTKSFDDGGSGEFKTDVQNFEYSAAAHDMVTKATQTGSDGVIYETNYRYPADYVVTSAWTQQDEPTRAISKLLDKNIIAPVETWSKKKEGSETPVVTGADLSVFGYNPSNDVVFIRRKYSAVTRDPLAGFQPSTVSNAGGASSFTFDNSAYNRYIDYLHQDNSGNSRSQLSFSRKKSGFHTDLVNGVVKATIANALADEVAFSDFESATGYDFTSTGNNTVSGRTQGSGLNLLAGSARKLSKTLNKGYGNSYVFSCWLNATSDGSLTVRVNDGVHSQVSSVINFTITDGTWKYFSTTLATASFNPAITVETESSVSVNIDDVLFFPAAAEVNTVLYGLAFAKVSETDTRGITTFYSYDNLGRLTKVSDRDLNILKRYSYSFEPKVLQTQISVSTVNGPRGSSSAYVDASTILNISPYYPGAEYKIKVASMTAPELITDFNTNAIITTTPSFTYIFPQTGSWLVNVMITYQGNVYHGYYSYIEVIDTPLTVSLCSNRPGRIDLCNSIPLISSCSSSSGLVLTAAVSGGSGSYSYIWTVDGSVSSQTSSSFNALHYEVSRIYECFVKDNNNPNKTGRSRFEIQVFQSNPFCLPPSQN